MMEQSEMFRMIERGFGIRDLGLIEGECIPMYATCFGRLSDAADGTGTGSLSHRSRLKH